LARANIVWARARFFAIPRYLVLSNPPEALDDPEGVLAGGAHVAQLLGPAEEMKAEAVYLVLEGHRTFSFVLVSQQERRRKVPLALLRFSEVSRPLRRRSL